MGVQGLWQLVNSTGHPVTLESLENKVLAVDVSIWLHQALRGCRNQYSGPSHNAHLVTLFNRICKLLFYRIKPVFVFDGGVPLLKKQTIAARRQRKEMASKESDQTLQKLLKNLLHRRVVGEKVSALDGNSKSVGAQREADVFELPILNKDPGVRNEAVFLSESSDESDVSELAGTGTRRNYYENLEAIDVHSEDFSCLPFEIQHEILTEMKESRKRNSWAQMADMPKDSNNFSSFQMTRLLKRRNLQERLENVEKELNSTDRASYGLLGDEMSASIASTSQRIMSEDFAHYILVKNNPSNVKNNPKNESGKTTEREKIVEITPPSIDESTSSYAINDCSGEIIKTDEIFVKPNNTLEYLQETVQNYFKNNPTTVKPRFSGSSFGKDIIDISDESVDEVTNKIPDYEKQIESQVQLSNENSSSDDENTAEISVLKVDRKEETAVQDHPEYPIITSIDFGAIDVRSSQVPAIDVRSSQVPAIENSTVNDDSSDHSDFEEVIDIDLVDGIVESLRENNEQTVPDLVSTNANNTDELPLLTKDSSGDTVSEEVKNNEESTFTESVPEPIVLPETLDELKELDKDLKEEELMLRKEKAKLDSVAASVTDQMYAESQELLRLFGVPYVVSPMEAEAQCAFLDLKEMTQGTITDDSDVWLFGGQRVYKNFFNQTKIVECFNVKDIENNYNLDREKLICLALLTGSDYTDGIEGVGTVTALEILSEFASEGIECLRNFKQWWDNTQSQKKIPEETPIKKKLRKLTLHSGFPNEVVMKAYLDPVVDESLERFSWGKPDLASLRDFTQSKFGWSREKVDGILLPVIKNLNLKETQTRIDSFFKVTLTKAPKAGTSKRVKRAIKRMSNKLDTQQENDQSLPPSEKKAKKPRRKETIRGTSAPKRTRARKTKKSVAEKKKAELSEESSD